MPFVVQWPAAIPAGQTSDAPVIGLDIFPTSLAAAGIDKSPGQPLHGANLVPLMSDKATTRPHETLYWKNGSTWAVRHGDLKLVAGNRIQNGSAPELFDLSTDPSEFKNLATDRPDDVKKLQSLYDTWAAQVKPTPWAESLRRRVGDNPDVNNKLQMKQKKNK